MDCLPNFDVMSQFPADIMHDIFEGAFPLVMQHVLKGLLQDSVLKPSDLDEVSTFHYGRNDRTNRQPQSTEAFVRGMPH